MAAAPKYKIPGPGGLNIVRAAVADGVFTCAQSSQVTLALRASDYLDRDQKNGNIFRPNEKASLMLAFLDEREAAAEATTPVVAGGRDMFGLVDTVLRAQSALDAGDVMAAKQLAGGAYLDAKARAQYAASFGAAGKRVVAKARQLQGDALLIERRAKMSMAAAHREAQATGTAAKQGRPKNIPDENVFTLEEAGLSAKELHEAREALAAEEREPGFAERAIAAMLVAGLEPSRNALKKSAKVAVGTSTATNEERGVNLYETGPQAMPPLFAVEQFSATVWDPACGPGAIVRMLEAEGYEVELSDLVDYETADQYGAVQTVVNFMDTEHSPAGADTPCPDIVTNPPYGDDLDAFVAHALTVHKPRKMALLMNLNVICGIAPLRDFYMEEFPPARIYANKRRLPMMHRDGWEGKKANSQMNTAWFVWERDEAGNYGNTTVLYRVDWKMHMPALPLAEADVAAESEAA